VSKLSELLNERNSGPRLSIREIGRRSGVSHGIVSAMFRGTYGSRPTRETIEGLASVLPVTVAELREAADLPPDTGTPWSLPEEARYLDERQRAALAQLIKTMVPKAADAPLPVAEDEEVVRLIDAPGPPSPPAPDPEPTGGRRRSAPGR